MTEARDRILNAKLSRSIKLPMNGLLRNTKQNHSECQVYVVFIQITVVTVCGSAMIVIVGSGAVGWS